MTSQLAAVMGDVLEQLQRAEQVPELPPADPEASLALPVTMATAGL